MTDIDAVWTRVLPEEGKQLHGERHYRFPLPSGAAAPGKAAASNQPTQNDPSTLILPLHKLIQTLINAPTGLRSGPGMTVSAHALRLNLGRLRGAHFSLQDYNSAPSSALGRFRLEELVTMLGTLPSPSESRRDDDAPSQELPRVIMPGLEELIHELSGGESERHVGDHVSFDQLDLLFAPGTLVRYPTGLGDGSVVTARVRSCQFEERRSALALTGRVDRIFNVQLEFLVPLASARLGLIAFTETFSGWAASEERKKRIADLLIRPLRPDVDADELQSLRRAAIHGFSMLPCTLKSDAYRYLAYAPGAFVPHASASSTRGSALSGGATTGSRTAGGRIIVDGNMALALGHYPISGSSEADQALLSAVGRFKRAGDRAEGILVLPLDDPSAFDERLVPLLYPAVAGFSLSAKRWGHVSLCSLKEIRFNRSAFDQLVLSPERKRLIRAVVNAQQPGSGQEARTARFRDIIASKSGGTVFLLHGAPGVGKTLTAEAVAEMLGRPVYYVTMGELGTAVEQVEARLADVLELCSAWQAIVLIDEADVFLERRTSGGSSDILRNALVCVLLRLIEYFSGILFLTTNRVASFDPAVESRVTIALRYDALDAAAREKVWRNLIANISNEV
ncbi:hypothetical protein OC846_005145 [Tilletia horrida]|uniref:AAA+ ATPase domain-containing protein n=1 Tax=Tilletia horrida TaxID=155126 RepID=A0AAN6GNJ7_9BASI|nr:hypothetical protein OC846_005145 [Tilletia horrida]KAK0569585.1 hypothetical protein OC861_000765 [Tilletia horrida]